MSRIKSALGILCFFITLHFLPNQVTQPIKNYGSIFARSILVFHQNRMDWLNGFGRAPDSNSNLLEPSRTPEAMRALEFKITELEAEQTRLYELLDFKNTMADANRFAVPARVIGRSTTGWRDSIILDRGSKEMVRLGMLVMTASGLVGKIIGVSEHMSTARLITDPRFKAGGLIQRTRYTGVVYGTADGECRMKYLPIDGDIKPGDIVLTAGLTAGFPKGVPIGVVSDVWREHGRIYKVAEIKPFSESNRVEEVLCVLR